MSNIYQTLCIPSITCSLDLLHFAPPAILISLVSTTFQNNTRTCKTVLELKKKINNNFSFKAKLSHYVKWQKYYSILSYRNWKRNLLSFILYQVVYIKQNLDTILTFCNHLPKLRLFGGPITLNLRIGIICLVHVMQTKEFCMQWKTKFLWGKPRECFWWETDEMKVKWESDDFYCFPCVKNTDLDNILL